MGPNKHFEKHPVDQKVKKKKHIKYFKKSYPTMPKFMTHQFMKPRINEEQLRTFMWKPLLLLLLFADMNSLGKIKIL